MSIQYLNYPYGKELFDPFHLPAIMSLCYMTATFNMKCNLRTYFIPQLTAGMEKMESPWYTTGTR